MHVRYGRTAAAIAAASTVSILLAGCGDNGASDGGSSGGVVKLTMLTGFTGPDAPSYQALIKEFNASHPKIQVTMTTEPWATIGQKLPASWATGQGPDLATPSSDPGAIFNYIKTNSVLPLDSAVGTGSTQINSSAFPETVKSAFTVQGKLYAVPANMATLVLYYNKDMFKAAGITQPPATEAEFIADAKKLTKGSGGKPSQYGLSLADNNTIQMWPILQWMSGGDIVGSDNCAAVNSPASVAALTKWSSLVDKDHISPVGQAGADADTLFSSKKAAMEINGPWAAAGFKSAGVDLGIAQVPVGSAGPVTLASTVPLMIARTSKHQEQAKEFLAWYTGKAAQTQFSKISGFPPARTDLGSAVNANPTAAQFAAALPHAKLYLAGQENATKIDTDAYVPLIQKIERGADVKSAADDAAKKIDSYTGCKR
ncbi:carbohydrate ABC transporter substrate-binding protein, CUT1 family [Actinacidiphila alni]|uniref:Carbohydrate ABC transporter substrate-binding protein, CUT1 family n=1 Tax=Actinacidiphila alni TaxID=380248 RepID=A0A1I2MFQ8_9ACTN|nr:ABC transporter substrate-binding protein [Actinacidiphila alni]SFF89740.1 carbohydrate ABC transporter substrate-binding protein, CUT1 family [Actinacidiphila alni]